MTAQNCFTVFCVTNDITYDQRMQRICTTLQHNGYAVLLVGRKLKKSTALPTYSFRTHRLSCIFETGFLFYAEFNIRLFFYLLTIKVNAFCAIDLDTIVPVLLASVIKQKPRLYDAHELFTEQKEIVTRKCVHKLWLAIERFCVPKFKYGYTVNTFIQEELQRRYGVKYGVVRNIPVKVEGERQMVKDEWQKVEGERQKVEGERQMVKDEKDKQEGKRLKEEDFRQTGLAISNQQSNINNNLFILYQGAVNEGRSFETLIPAMQSLPCKLLICGEGNFFEQTKTLIKQYNLQDKIELRGYVAPDELKKITPTAFLGLTLFENTGLNQYYSLSNRFFDYVMAGIPQVCVGYPEYKTINQQYNIALLIDDTQTTTIVHAIDTLLNDTVLYQQLQQNCYIAREFLTWQNEEKKLLNAWHECLRNDTKTID